MIVYAKSGRVINLGRCGDSNATTVMFDLSDWVASYGAGSVSLFYEVNGSKTIEAVATGSIDESKTNFSWLIEKAITDEPGIGHCQLVFKSKDEKVQNVSIWYDTLVMTSIYYDIDYSEDAVDWLDTLAALCASLDGRAGSVETAVDEAQQWARGTKGENQEPVSEGEIGYKDNSKYYAKLASESQTSAAKSEAYLRGLTIKENIVDIGNGGQCRVVKNQDPDTGIETWTFDIPVNAPFKVAKWYKSKKDMDDDLEGDTVKVGEFASISSDLSDPENGKLYVKIEEDSVKKWYFLCDLSGEQGIRGPQGPKGDKGDTGAQGATGATGPQGDQGPKGDTGATGPQGPKGDTGATGSQGEQGIQGEKGDKGDIFVPTVSENGDLSWTLETSPSIAPSTQNIKGPQGDKGDKGDTGEQGPQGEQGETGPKGADGTQITIDEANHKVMFS